MNVFGRLRQPSRLPLLQVGKTSLAVVVAWLAASAVTGTHYPYFAAIAALLVVQPSINQSFGRGLERTVGVIAGVALAFVIGTVFGGSSWVVLLVVVLAIFIAWVLRLTPTSSTQVPISAMLVLSVGIQTPHYALDRIIDTAIGAVIALAINALVAPPVLLPPARLAVGRLARDTAAVLDGLSDVLRVPAHPADLDALLTGARALRPLAAKSTTALTAASESLTLNPRASRQRRILEADLVLDERLGNLVNRVIVMTRTLHDHYSPEIVDDAIVHDIAEQLGRAAHDVRLLVRDTEAAAGGANAGSEPMPGPEDARAGSPAHPEDVVDRARDLPALTSPLTVPRPDPDNWVLIGSMLEDLRRVREEIVGDVG